jgi:hypothetical protein
MCPEPEADGGLLAGWLKREIEKIALRVLAKDDAVTPHHAALDSHAGHWAGSMSTWLTPGQPYDVQQVTSTAQWALGGRFLAWTFDGRFIGQPFSAVCYTGYDDVTQQYVAIWIDSATTAMMPFTGSIDAATGTLTLFSTIKLVDVPGLSADVRAVITMPDANHLLAEFSIGRFGIWVKAHVFDLARVTPA